VRLTPDQSLDLAGLVAFLKEQKVALQYMPERREILDVMPATASGKIQKFRMREMLLQQPA
jgi:cyclohexanecarboxylate-CoA ligase